jgi:C4-type Zn-finger protein
MRCPHCHQRINSQVINCPRCRTPLKAHGHLGIPLHQAEGETILCDTCVYEADDTCTFPQRPYAKTCTLYQNKAEPLVEEEYKLSPGAALKAWVRQNKGFLLLFFLISISILLVIT